MDEPESAFIKIPEEDRKRFESIGLAQLKQLAAMPGSAYPNMPVVMGWIAEQEQKIQDDQLAAVRSAKEAAWEAAHASRKASLIAKWALGVAVVSALAAFLSAWLQFHALLE